jgi:hypothetical protein
MLANDAAMEQENVTLTAFLSYREWQGRIGVSPGLVSSILP